MDDILHLDLEEDRVVDTALRRLLHPTSTESVRDLLRKWEAFVAEVESGYRLTLYDYENDLGTRSALRELVASIPRELSDRIRLALRPLDRRFEKATEPFPRGLLAERRLPEEDWWYFRKPLVLTGELAGDWEQP